MSVKVRILLIIFVVLCINLSQGAIVSKEVLTEQHFMRSYHDTYLSGHPDGVISLTRNLEDWEKWKLVSLGNQQFFIVSFHGTYLSANKNMTVKLSKQSRQQQRWTKEIRDGLIYWKSSYGTYLSGEPGAVTLKVVPDIWERWVITNTQVFLRSYHGTYLGSTPVGGVRLTKDLMDWQKWKVISVGNSQFIFMSLNGTYLSANNDKSVSMVNEPRETQKWTRVIKDTFIYWKSIFDTYLSARPQLNLNLQPIPDIWERWTVSNTQVFLKSTLGTSLSGSPDDTVSLNSNFNTWEKWKIIYLGNQQFLIVSVYGGYLSVFDPLKLVNKPPQSWEIWTRVRKDGFLYWKSFFGTYMSADSSGKVPVKQKLDVTTQWTMIDL